MDWLYTDTPVTSLGSRSGVNWMREKVPPMEAAMERASIVLPTPGTSSTRMCPSAMRAASAISITSLLPTMTVATLSAIRCATAAASRMAGATPAAGETAVFCKVLSWPIGMIFGPV